VVILACFQPPCARRVCAGLARADVSPCALCTLGRATAQLVGAAARHRKPHGICGGGKVAIPAILTRLPDPGRAVRLQDSKVLTFGRALHPAWSKCRQRGGLLRGIGGSLLRSQSRAFYLAAWGRHVVWSNCDRRLACSDGRWPWCALPCFYSMYNDTTGRSEEFFSESSTLISITEIRYLFGVRAWNLHPRMESTSLLCDRVGQYKIRQNM